MTLTEINYQRAPAWIAEYRLWANHERARATEARERGNLNAARRHDRLASEYEGFAARVEANLVGFASV
jgi:hypothetical protein